MLKWILVATAVLACGSARAAPLEVYGKLPSVEDVSISPDGSRLAMILTDGEKRTIRIENLAQHKIERVLDAGDAKLRGLLWGGPDHLIVLRSTTATIVGLDASKREYFLGFDYNLTTGIARGLLRDVNSAALNIVINPQIRTIDGKPVLFVEGLRFSDSRTVLSVYRIDLDHDTSTVVAQGAGDTEDFVLGADGSPIAQTTSNDRTRLWSLKLKTNGGWREVRTEPLKSDTPDMLGLGRDGRSVLIGELRDGDILVREVSAKGDWSEPLPVRDEEGALFDPLRHNLIGASGLIGDEQRYAFFDPADQQVWQLVQRAYPNQRVQLVSWSDDRKKIVVLADSPQEGPGYGLVDLETHHADWIINRYAKLGPGDISPVRPIQFKAADGAELTGYLTTPRGVDAKKLPLVVFPHGGPAARDEPGFDWWAQAMASRGYAVLQVNFRGTA